MFPWEDFSSSVCRAQRERTVSSWLGRAFSTLIPTQLVPSPYGRDQQQPPEQQPEPSDSWQQLEPPECWPLPPPQQPELWGLRRWDLRRLRWPRQQPPHPELQQPPELGPQQGETGGGHGGGHLGGHLGGGNLGVGHLGGSWHCCWLCWQDILQRKSVHLGRNAKSHQHTSDKQIHPLPWSALTPQPRQATLWAGYKQNLKTDRKWNDCSKALFLFLLFSERHGTISLRGAQSQPHIRLPSHLEALLAIVQNPSHNGSIIPKHIQWMLVISENLYWMRTRRKDIALAV